MNRLHAVAILSALSLVLAARAQSLLDGQLEGTTPARPAETDTARPAAKPADATGTGKDKAARAAGDGNASDVINPNAVKKVDDADLINKLTGPEAPANVHPVKQRMADMLERMGQSQKRLSEKDPGDVTQETQRRIVADLDVLIELARQQQQSGSSQSNQNQQQGTERGFSQGTGPQNQAGSTAARDSFLPKGGHAEPVPGEDIHSHSPDEWGKLAPRDRDLISHGANEQYLSSYRDLIDRYYQALAEIGKTRNR